MTDRELMQQALGALMTVTSGVPDTWDGVVKASQAIEALRARLAQCDAGEICLGCRVCPDAAQPEPEQRTGDCLLTGVCASEGHRIQKAQPEPKPVAWRTFDGEGGYEYRDYELNEDYGYWWEERHPNHKNWVQPLYIDPTPCQTCEALARTVMMDQTSHDIQPQREWQGLTDEETEEVANSVGYNPLVMTVYEYRVAVQKATEAKLKEKNT